MAADDSAAGELGELRSRLAKVEATLAITELKARYGELVDARYARGRVVPSDVLDDVVGRTVELFTEDATWDGGPSLGVAVGRAEIAERLKRPTLSFSRHFFVKPRIEVDLPIATARWDLLCPCRTPDGRSWWMSGYEDDTYRLERGKWIHSSMKLTTLFMSPAGEGFDQIFA